jgi:dTDP-4-dehydrorhamnose reductase
MKRTGYALNCYSTRYGQLYDNSMLGAQPSATNLAGKTLVVLGSTGLLGQALLRQATVFKIRAVGVARTNAEVNVDITQTTAMQNMINQVKPDLIINAAALVSLEQCEADPGSAYLINAAPIATLAGLCREKKIKFIQISTDHYYVGQDRILHAETAPIALVNQYAKTKFAGESFASTLNDALIIRTNIVGFRGWLGRPTFVEWVIETLLKKEKMNLFSNFYTSSIDAQSCAKYILEVIGKDASGVINLAANDCISKAEFIYSLAKELNLSTENCTVRDMVQSKGLIRANNLGLDTQCIEQLLGHKMPSSRDVISSIAEQYRGLQ